MASDEELDRQRRVLTSVKGIGPIISAVLLSHMPELGRQVGRQWRAKTSIVRRTRSWARVRVAKEPGPVLPAAAVGREARSRWPELVTSNLLIASGTDEASGVGRYPNRADSRRGPCAPDAARLPGRGGRA